MQMHVHAIEIPRPCRPATAHKQEYRSGDGMRVAAGKKKTTNPCSVCKFVPGSTESGFCGQRFFC